MSEANHIGVELMMTDAKTALTLLDMADTTTNPEDRERRLAEAHRAYLAIHRFLNRLSPTPEQQQVLAERLSSLETRLSKAGVALNP